MLSVRVDFELPTYGRMIPWLPAVAKLKGISSWYSACGNCQSKH